jgi:hypothetical protein
LPRARIRFGRSFAVPDAAGSPTAIAYFAGDCSCTKEETDEGEAVRLRVRSGLGEHVIVVATPALDLECVRFTGSLTPATALVVPFMPRDLYPLDANDDPTGASGHVEAAQRGPNCGVLYFQLEEPAFGNVLYFQNLTALNAHYRATKTTPDGAVGGEWPELGLLLPTPPQSGTPPVHPLPPGEPVTISDAILVFRYDGPSDERDSARRGLRRRASPEAGRQGHRPSTASTFPAFPRGGGIALIVSGCPAGYSVVLPSKCS